MSQPRPAVDRLVQRLREELAGRRFLVTADVVQAVASRAVELRSLGAGPMIGVGARAGVGAVAELPDFTWHSLDLPPLPMMESIREAEAALQALPQAVLEAIDAFDPDRSALTVGPFFAKGDAVAGRAYYGARPAAWRALDDKTTVHALWDAAGVTRAPQEVVPATADALRDAAGRLDVGHGTVWAADSSQGWHGGTDRTWIVRGAADLERTTALATRSAAHVRVMPFLRGVPCSIHAFVLPDGVAVLRPCEMVVLHGPRGFRYMRFATFWEPAPAARAALREVARRTGEHLRTSIGYRGAFTVDGVLTDAGFRPTELNPRMGAAMPMVLGPDFPTWSVHDALVAGFDPGVRAADLEADLLPLADASRAAVFGVSVDDPLPDGSVTLAWRRGQWEECNPPGDATMVTGRGPNGGYARLTLDRRTVEPGPPVADRAAAWIRWLDETHGTALGPCEPGWR